MVRPRISWRKIVWNRQLDRCDCSPHKWMDWWHWMPRQVLKRPYLATDIDVGHRICWQCSTAKSTIRNKWKWSTSSRSSGYPHVHVQLAMPSILTTPSYLWSHCCKCVCSVFVVAFERCSKCMSMKWWWHCMEVGNRRQTGISLLICHLFWVLYMRMFVHPGQAFPKRPESAAPSSKTPKTTPKIIEAQLCAADKIECTDDDEQLKCIWKEVRTWKKGI